MSLTARRFAGLPGGLIVSALLLPAAAVADGEPVPRYTYLGAGYEWADAKCAIEPETEGVSGYTAEGSLGIFDFLHLTGAYFDGETDGENLDVTCYELGAGLSYRFAQGSDIILRGYWVRQELEDVDDDGFEPELLVRHMLSDRADIQVGVAHYDIDDETNTEVRTSIVYNIRPWIAVRAGGVLFDEDTSFFAGIRLNLGGNIF